MIEAYFPRTIEVLKALNLMTVFDDLSSTVNTNDLDATVSFAESISTDKTILQNQSSDLIREIVSTELDKYTLRDNHEKLAEIAKKEFIFNQEREILLTSKKDKLREIDFIMSPFVNIYMSDYKIIWDITKDEFMLADNIGKPESEHYYLFQRIDIHDQFMSNILEFPLTQYECFILQLFEQTKRYQDVLIAFKDIFDYETTKEEQVIEHNFEHILNYFIFKKFLIKVEHHS